MLKHMAFLDNARVVGAMNMEGKVALVIYDVSTGNQATLLRVLHTPFAGSRVQDLPMPAFGAHCGNRDDRVESSVDGMHLTTDGWSFFFVPISFSSPEPSALEDEVTLCVPFHVLDAFTRPDGETPVHVCWSRWTGPSAEVFFVEDEDPLDFPTMCDTRTEPEMFEHMNGFYYGEWHPRRCAYLSDKTTLAPTFESSPILHITGYATARMGLSGLDHVPRGINATLKVQRWILRARFNREVPAPRYLLHDCVVSLMTGEKPVVRRGIPQCWNKARVYGLA